MMNLIVMDYSTGEVDVVTNVPDSVDAIEFIEETLGRRESDVSWMATNSKIAIEFKDYASLTKEK